MEGGALFKVRSEAKARVLAAFTVIDIRKNEVGSYAYNDANTTTIRQHFVHIAGMVFDWRDTVAINVKNSQQTLPKHKRTVYASMTI